MKIETPIEDRNKHLTLRALNECLSKRAMDRTLFNDEEMGGNEGQGGNEV